MAQWKPLADPGRWELEDEVGSRHLLLKRENHYFELHGVTVHTYVGSADVVDAFWPLGTPFDDAAAAATTHVRSEIRETVAFEKTDAEAWKWLERYAEAELGQ